MAFKAVLPPGAFQLIAIGHSAAKAVGQSLGTLKTSNHSGDVHIPFLRIGFGW